MVVLDSSAVIPLARVGSLQLIQQQWIQLRTTPGVQQEVLADGYPGTAALSRFFGDVEIRHSDDTTSMARQTGLHEEDAAILQLANEQNDPLLAHDGALMNVAQSLGIERYWVPGVVLTAAKDGRLSPDTAADLVLDLVDSGVALQPRVCAGLLREIRHLE